MASRSRGVSSILTDTGIETVRWSGVPGLVVIPAYVPIDVADGARRAVRGLNPCAPLDTALVTDNARSLRHGRDRRDFSCEASVFAGSLGLVVKRRIWRVLHALVVAVVLRLASFRALDVRKGDFAVGPLALVDRCGPAWLGEQKHNQQCSSHGVLPRDCATPRRESVRIFVC